MVNNSHQHQQTEKSSLNSDGEPDHHCLEMIVRFVDIGVNGSPSLFRDDCSLC
jgi:hypothetical protein